MTDVCEDALSHSIGMTKATPRRFSRGCCLQFLRKDCVSPQSEFHRADSELPLERRAEMALVVVAQFDAYCADGQGCVEEVMRCQLHAVVVEKLEYRGAKLLLERLLQRTLVRAHHPGKLVQGGHVLVVGEDDVLGIVYLVAQDEADGLAWREAAGQEEARETVDDFRLHVLGGLVAQQPGTLDVSCRLGDRCLRRLVVLDDGLGVEDGAGQGRKRLECLKVAVDEFFDVLLGDDHVEDFELGAAVQVGVGSALAVQEAEAGLARFPYHFLACSSLLAVHLLHAPAKGGHGEHQCRAHFVPGNELDVVLLAQIVLVHDAELPVMPLLERNFQRIRFDVVAPFHAVVVEEGESVLRHVPFCLSVSCYLAVYHVHCFLV